MCYLEFAKGRSSIAKCSNLVDLMVQHYCFRDLSVLTPLSQLKSLWFSQGSLGDISEIGAFPNLTQLTIALMRNLTDIGPISDLKRLETLEITVCKKFGRLDALSSLPNLRKLEVTDCGPIDSLAPLLGCPNLEYLGFGGETIILDGDVALLTRMPKLKTVLFKNRKSYNKRREDIPAFPRYA
jgi:Leucine-rich repeat (LRR) protein